MALRFPSEEWIQELSRQLNASEAYERAAKDWEGDFVFIIEGDQAFPRTAYLYLDLYHGKSPGAEQLDCLEGKSAAYVLAAPFSTWRQVIEGKLDPIQGMLTRKLRLKGNLMQVMRYPKAAKEIVSCCALVPTDFGS